MSVTFLSSRLTDASFVSSVDDAVRELEAAIAEYFGITLDTAHEAIMAVNPEGFITSLLTTGVKIYKTGETNVAENFAFLKLDNTDTDNPFLIIHEKDEVGTGIMGIEAGKIKLSDSSTPVYIWTDEAGQFALSATKDPAEDRVTLRMPVEGTDGNLEIITTPPATSADIGKVVVCEENSHGDFVGVWGIQPGIYLMAHPTAGSIVTDDGYPTARWLDAINDDSHIISVADSQSSIYFSEAGVYLIQGMVQLLAPVGEDVNAETTIVDRSSSSIPGSQIASHGGGLLAGLTGIGWGNCVFGATVIVKSANLGSDCKVVLRLDVGGGGFNNIGQWGYISVNRISGINE